MTLIILKVDIWYFIGAAWELVSADSDTNTVTNADTNTDTNTGTKADTNMYTNIDVNTNTNTDTNTGANIWCFIGPPSSSLGIGISCFQRFSSKSLEAETNPN